MKKVKNFISVMGTMIILVSLIFALSACNNKNEGFFPNQADEVDESNAEKYSTDFGKYLDFEPYKLKKNLKYVNTICIDSTPGNGDLFRGGGAFYQITFFKNQRNKIYPQGFWDIDKYRKNLNLHRDSIKEARDVEKITFDEELHIEKDFFEMYLTKIAKKIPARGITKVAEYDVARKLTIEDIVLRIRPKKGSLHTLSPAYFLTTDQVRKVVHQFDASRPLLELRPTFLHFLVISNDRKLVYSVLNSSYEGLYGDGHYVYSVSDLQKHSDRMLPPGKLFARRGNWYTETNWKEMK